MTIDIWAFIYSPIYYVGHFIGAIVIKLIQIISGIILPDVIGDTVGLLTIVTILLTLVEIARKITWGILTICWALILIRVGLLMMGS